MNVIEFSKLLSYCNIYLLQGRLLKIVFIFTKWLQFHKKKCFSLFLKSMIKVISRLTNIFVLAVFYFIIFTGKILFLKRHFSLESKFNKFCSKDLSKDIFAAFQISWNMSCSVRWKVFLINFTKRRESIVLQNWKTNHFLFINKENRISDFSFFFLQKQI